MDIAKCTEPWNRELNRNDRYHMIILSWHRVVMHSEAKCRNLTFNRARRLFVRLRTFHRPKEYVFFRLGVGDINQQLWVQI